MLQAIVFDFDGVIVDSEPLHYRAFLAVGRPLGVSFSYDEYLAEYVGFDDRDAFRHMLASAGQPVDEAAVAELCERKQPAFDELVEREPDGRAFAIPGSLELIDECHAAGFPMAIASGATRADIELMLHKLGRRDRFDIIVTADDVARSKPDPASYALAAERLGVAPGSCLAIEDTAAGLASAAAAGLQTLALTTTTDADALTQAARVLPDLSGVTLDQLRGWYG